MTKTVCNSDRNASIEYGSCADVKENETGTGYIITNTNHDYGAADYSWSADKSTCTASRVCQKDKTHIETEKATVTSAVTTQPTYEKTGVRTYTAAFKNAAFSTQTQTETIAKRVKPQENIQTKTSIKKASVSGISNKNYNGKSQKQSIKVKLGKKTLKQGTDYTVSYKNNKNIYFRFNENGVLIVTCHKKVSKEEIKSLIFKNEDAIIKMYQKAVERKKYNESYHLLGKTYNVEFNESIDNVYINGDFIYAKNEDDLNKFTEEEINRVFNEEVSICKNCFNNLPEFTLKFRQMKTRWGVCNRRDNIITLNKELIKKEVWLLDYVIIHEMAHFYEGNHSKKFWNIVSLACPNYKEARKELRK